MAGFKKRITEHFYTQNIKAPKTQDFLEQECVCFFHCKYMGANVPWVWTILNPRGIIGKIYVKDHITLLHTKYCTSFWFCSFKEDVFHMFFYYKMVQVGKEPMADNDVPGAWPVRTPEAWLSGFIKRSNNDAPGRGLYGPQGHGWQYL